MGKLFELSGVCDEKKIRISLRQKRNDKTNWLPSQEKVFLGRGFLGIEFLFEVKKRHNFQNLKFE